MLLLPAYLSRTLRIGYGFQIIAKVKEVTSSSSLQLSTPAQCDLDTLSLDLVLILTFPLQLRTFKQISSLHVYQL